MTFTINLLFTLIAIATLVAFILAANTGLCASRWADSGMQSKFVPFGGCMVEVRGAWLPEDAVRVEP